MPNPSSLTSRQTSQFQIITIHNLDSCSSRHFTLFLSATFSLFAMADRRPFFRANPLIDRPPLIFRPTRPLFLVAHHHASRQNDKGSVSGGAPQSDAVDPSAQPVNQGLLPTPVPASDVSGASILGNVSADVADGLAFGTGNGVADRAGDVVLGGCGNHAKAFQECLNNYGSSTSRCQFYLDTLNDCRGNSRSVMGV